MITIRELFSDNLPDVDAGGTAAEKEEALHGFLLAGISAASAANPHKGHIFGDQGSRAPLPGPYLGPTPEVAPSSEVVQAHLQAVKDSRQRVCEHLRNALVKRATSRNANSRPATGRCSSAVSSTAPVEVPAVFPFPEPIPKAPPSRSSPTTRASSAFAVPRREKHVALRKVVNNAAFVPAVFPFPEPIPHCPPERRPPAVCAASSLSAASTPRSVAPARLSPRETTSSRLAVIADTPHSTSIGSASPASMQGVSAEDIGSNSGTGQRARDQIATRKYAVTGNDEEVEFDENRERANRWISECAPKTWLLEHERPVWLQWKLKHKRERIARETMFRNMPSMPFDLWLRMKHGLAANAAKRHDVAAFRRSLGEESEEKELRNYYTGVAMARRMRMNTGDIRTTTRSVTGPTDDQ
eukprot:TRINITY_DN44037_c0_g1_i1.p1 TRINITY_DN44037_c0_g1~~TRINITY_DN44037_c0_g1_i1.p1  ORF type:complete len:413 (+),score=49.16 TRINITY_DN44037_c0_g1_i1:183-1421(+)